MNIIDSLVVALRLDRREYDEERKKFEQDRKRLGEEERKANQDTERQQGRLISGMRTLRNETAGFLFALAGANSLRQFSMDLVNSDAAVGRLAANLGMAVENVSAWGGAVKTVGGEASSAFNALRSLSSIYQSLLLTGQSGNDADIKGLGLTGEDLRDPEQALLKISDAAARIPRAEFTERLRRLGFDESMITLLSKGRRGLQEVLAEQRRLGVATEESARKAQEFEAALARLETKLTDFGRVILMEFGPSAEKLLTWLTESKEGTYAVATAFGVVVLATTGWLGPLALLSAALGGLVGELNGVSGALNTISMGFEVAAIRAQIFYHQQRANLYGNVNPEARLHELEKVSELNQRLVDIADSETAQRAIQSRWRGSRANEWFGGPKGAYRSTPSWAQGSLDSIDRGGSRNGNPARRPRGTRAVALDGNNPGGIIDGPFARSQPGYAGNNGRYAAFWTMQDGVNAQRALLASYVRRGIDTPAAIARRWAPASDGNDPAGYAANIARQLGIGVNDRISQRELNAFGHAQAIQENSRYGREQLVRPSRGGGFRPVSYQSTSSIGEIKIYTQATDADGIARDMRTALVQRGIISQASTGLVA